MTTNFDSFSIKFVACIDKHLRPSPSLLLSLPLLLLLIYNVCKMFLLLLMVKIFGLFTVIFYTHTLTHIFPFLPAGCLRISISIEFV